LALYTQHNGAVYAEERAEPARLRKHIADLSAEAERVRAAGDSASAEVFDRVVSDMRSALPEVQAIAVRRSYARVNRALDMEVDLHTLHGREVAPLLDRKLGAARELAADQVVRVCIIAGRGAHSEGGEPKLKPVVRAYLAEHHPVFEEEVGCFRITLQPFDVRRAA
jgi:DNA-nicking Smr family endonuclease